MDIFGGDHKIGRVKGSFLCILHNLDIFRGCLHAELALTLKAELSPDRPKII